MNKLIYTCWILLAFLSCKDDDGNEAIVLQDEERQAFVLNEGNFQFGNASLSLYYMDDKESVNFLFQSNNSGRPIGDVVQSMEIIDDKAYIVVNNSSKIEVVNINDFKSIGNLSPFNSPRYILPINAGKAYVSDLYEGAISIIDPAELSIKGTIQTGGWTEEMILHNGKAFVCHMDSSEVLVIDTQNDQIIDRIATAIEPQHIRKDKNGMLWVSCSGGFEEGLSALIQINPDNHQVMKKLSDSSLEQSIGELEMNAAADQVYYLSNGGLYRLGIEEMNLSTQAFIPDDGRLFYGLGLDHQTDEIYLSDAIDYQQHGVVFRFDANGNELDHFRVGIIPGDFVFHQ